VADGRTGAPVRLRTVRVWCSPCRGWAELEGPVYEDRADSPVHITPDVLQAHREEAKHP
jgi:hypothetical protein